MFGHHGGKHGHRSSAFLQFPARTSPRCFFSKSLKHRLASSFPKASMSGDQHRPPARLLSSGHTAASLAICVLPQRTASPPGPLCLTGPRSQESTLVTSSCQLFDLERILQSFGLQLPSVKRRCEQSLSCSFCGISKCPVTYYLHNWGLPVWPGTWGPHHELLFPSRLRGRSVCVAHIFGSTGV
jgi:hypothetical protein